MSDPDSFSVEEVVPRDFQVPTMGHFHEGTRLLGYWKHGDSYLFRGFGGHILCVSAEFLRRIYGEHIDPKASEE